MAPRLEQNKTIESNNCLKADCPNWGTLVIDANVVHYVLRGTIHMVAATYVNRTWPQRLPNVKASFKSNLELIKRCSSSSNGKLQASEPVLNELDADRISESACPLDRSRSVYTQHELQELVLLIQNCFCTPVITINQEILELQSLLRSYGVHLKDRDTSLIVAACKITQQGVPTIIVTADPHFIEPWEILSQLKSIQLQGVLYSTEELMLRTYSAFMTQSHDCCNCSSDIYRPLFNAWFTRVFNLVSYGTRRRSQQLVGEMTNTFSTAYEVMQASLTNKWTSIR